MTINLTHDSSIEGNFPTTEELDIKGISVMTKQNGYFKEDVKITIDEDIERTESDLNLLIFELGRYIGAKMMRKMM